MHILSRNTFPRRPLRFLGYAPRLFPKAGYAVVCVHVYTWHIARARSRRAIRSAVFTLFHNFLAGAKCRLLGFSGPTAARRKVVVDRCLTSLSPALCAPIPRHSFGTGNSLSYGEAPRRLSPSAAIRLVPSHFT